MKVHKYLMILYVIFVLCSLARDIQFINSIPIYIYKAVIIGLSILYVVITFRQTLPAFAKWLLLLIIIISLYFYGADANAYNNTTYSNTIIPLLSFFPIYYFARNGLISDKYLSLFTYALLIIIIISFVKTRHTAFSELAYDSDNVTINYGYLFATFVPLIFFRKKIVVQLILFFICLVGSVISVKRGAILSTSFGFALYIFYYLKQHNKYGGIKKFIINIMFVAIIWIGIYYLYMYSINNDAFMLRAEMSQGGDMSGRDTIISELWQIIMSQNDFNLIFGNGYSAVRNIIEIEAHNDWLEILVDYGIIGFTIYLAMVLSLIVFTFRYPILKFKYVLITGTTVWLIKSIFSMSFNNYNSIVLMIIFGYVFGIYSDKRRINNENSMLN